MNNRIERFTVGNDLGLEYHFDSRNDPPFSAIRHLSHHYPHLLFKLRSETVIPTFLFFLFKGGEHLPEDTTLEEDTGKRREELLRETEASINMMKKTLAARKARPRSSGKNDLPF